MKSKWVIFLTTVLVVLAFVFIVVAILMVVYAGAPSLGCCTQTQILARGAQAALSKLGPKHDASYALERSLFDAVGPCQWEKDEYRCEGIP